MTERLKLETTIAKGFLRGIKIGTPLAITYIPGAFAFGILAKTAGLTLWECVFMSFIVFAGASQFVAVNLITLGTPMAEILVAVGVLNMRHLLMSSSMSKRIPLNTRFLEKFWIFFEMTDESFTLASLQKEDYLSPKFLIGLNFPLHLTWVLGTFLGWAGGSALPDSLQESMGIAIYAIFIGLLVPSVRDNVKALTVTVIAMSLSTYIKLVPCLAERINKGLSIMITAGIAALFGAIVFSKKKNKDEVLS